MPRLRSLILNIHIYAGLLCAPYLIIFGISSLNFNHHFVEPGDASTTWSVPLRLDPSIEKREVGLAVRDSLDLMGWGPWWEVERDSLRTYAEVVRPGKRYNVTISDGVATIEEIRHGPLQVMMSLHALTNLPRSPFVSTWEIFTEICTWVVLFSAGSGVYLMAIKKQERRVGWIILATSGLLSITLFVYVIAVG
jgi:hypothetical protein